jgi:hypothetical protein
MIRAVYLLLVVEVILGGGGRLLEIGPITLRMVLFAAALILTVVAVAARGGLREAQVTTLLMTGFLAIQAVGVVIGLTRGNPPADVWSDLQPLLYWLALPFMAIAAEDRRNARATRDLIIGAGTVMAAGYLTVLLLLILGRIDFAWLHDLLGATDEFMFRGDKGFFYKGFVYLGVSIVFLVAVPGRVPRLLIGLTAVALVLTLTRSFVISTAIAVLMLLYALRMRVAATLGTLLAIGAAGTVLALSAGSLEGLLGDRAESNAIRIEDLTFVLTNLNPVTLLLGNGYGTPIVERLNVENAFLWIVWKTGLVGLVFWLSPLLLCAVSFSRVPRSDADFRLACAFMFSTVLIYVQSAMNPYLNNPIGLALVMIAIFSLRTLSSARPVPVDIRRRLDDDRRAAWPDLSSP